MYSSWTAICGATWVIGIEWHIHLLTWCSIWCFAYLFTFVLSVLFSSSLCPFFCLGLYTTIARFVTGNMVSCLLRDPTCVLGLTCLIKDIVNGNFDDEGRNYILASKLIGIIKPEGGIRPIAIGELFFSVVRQRMFDRRTPILVVSICP